MNRKTSRWLSVLLALCLALALLPGTVSAAAEAADLSAEAKAQALNKLGLFSGKGTNPDGTPDFALGDSATRNEAATMLIRLLGKESKAIAQFAAGTLQNVFNDTGWASDRVSWLYEAGYVNGTDNVNRLYGGNDPISAQAFAAMVLRALGYSETKGDYTYATALDFAVRQGLLTSAQRGAWESAFCREGMAEMCYNALELNMRASGLTLLEKLTNDGIFKSSYDTSLSGAAPMTLSLKYAGGGADTPYYAQEGATAATAGDVDGDGRLELIFNVRTNYCLDAATGRTKWKCESGHDVTEPGAQPFGQNTNLVPAQIVDLDGDGSNEVVIVSSTYAVAEGYGNVSVLTVYDGAGRFKFAPVYFQYRVHALEIADMDGDGRKEICIGLGVGGSGQGSIYIYNCDGTLHSGRWPADCGYGVYNNTFGVADVDGDGVKELIALNDQEYIAAFKLDGSVATISGGDYAGKPWNSVTVWENYDFEKAYNSGTGQSGGGTRETHNSIGGTRGGIAVADMDGDGTEELVFTAMIIDNPDMHKNMASGTGDSFKGNLQYFTTFILKTNHDRYTNPAKGFDWTQMPTDIGAWLTLEDYVNLPEPDLKPVVADIDGDGNQEILFSSNDGKVHCFNLDGTEHGAWPFSLDGRSSAFLTMASRPAVADLNGDGKLEVVFATYSEKDARTANRGTLYVLDCTGKVLARRMLEPYWGSSGGPNAGFAEPVLADVDNDGRLEIALTTESAGVCVYEIN